MVFLARNDPPRKEAFRNQEERSSEECVHSARTSHGTCTLDSSAYGSLEILHEFAFDVEVTFVV